jgi:hypothetical protein
LKQKLCFQSAKYEHSFSWRKKGDKILRFIKKKRTAYVKTMPDVRDFLSLGKGNNCDGYGCYILQRKFVVEKLHKKNQRNNEAEKSTSKRTRPEKQKQSCDEQEWSTVTMFSF